MQTLESEGTDDFDILQPTSYYRYTGAFSEGLGQSLCYRTIRTTRNNGWELNPDNADG